MFNIDIYNVAIDINLDNGIYIFDNESASGKTRLCKLFKRYQAYGVPVSAYTYNDYCIGLPIENVIDRKFKVILLDRYDLYEGIGAELIRQCARDSIILIDCKGNFTVTNEDDWCIVNMTQDRIEVTQ